MLNHIYTALEKRLSTVQALKNIDLFLDQFAQQGEDAVRITPAAYINFLPIDWTNQAGGVQKATIEFEVWLVNQTAYGDKRDLTDTRFINHCAIENSIYQALQNNAFKLSYIPEFASIANTSDDCFLIQSITRVRTETYSLMNNIISSAQVFQAKIYDLNASPDYQMLVLQLGLQVETEIVTNITTQI